MVHYVHIKISYLLSLIEERTNLQQRRKFNITNSHTLKASSFFNEPLLN